MLKTTGLQIDVVVKHTCLLGEGPVWDARCKVIYWIDILNGQIHEYCPEQNIHKTIAVGQMIGALAVRTNGNFIAALQNGFAFIDRMNNEIKPGGEIKMFADPESHVPNNRFNDGKCDPAGRFFAGTMSLSEEPNAGSVYVVEKDLTITKKIEGVTVSNGMAWSPDHQTFYFIDSPTSEVASYDYNASSGDISHKKIIIKVPKEDGHPDGMTIDNEGMLWIAFWDGWQIARWNPGTGEKLLSIQLPVAKVTSCTFGGETLQDLYITSASVGLTSDELKKQPLAGSLFVIKQSGFTGMQAFEFKG